nr:ABC transporter substrate-binding protein [Plesiomonas shigelloides]
MKKSWISGTLLACSLSLSAAHAEDTRSAWQQTLENAQGTTVYLNTVAGNAQLSNYLDWAKDEVKKRYNITLVHTETPNNTEIISRIMADKIAGKKQPGSSDIIWLHGKYFSSLRAADLLSGPFVDQLPNWPVVDQSLPVKIDATLPTDGYEAPWGLNQLTFIYDTARTATPPKSVKEMLTYAMQHPGKITYPLPSDIYGRNFLKAALLQLAPTPDVLYRDVKESDFKLQTAPLWQFLDNLHQYAWKNGKAFPANQAEMLALLKSGEIDMAISLNPNSVQYAINKGLIAPTSKAYALDQGAITRAHFLAIPFNAPTPDAAKVVINFLMSPEAQARKEDPALWGDPTILNISALGMEKARFSEHKPLFKILPEPHPSWEDALEAEWQRRYGAQGATVSP